jgi:hypothetical protein
MRPILRGGESGLGIVADGVIFGRLAALHRMSKI